jgi:hypothetical protein
MPVADKRFSSGRRFDGTYMEPRRSPLGGCWIEDIYYPSRWWLPKGTTRYYIAWILTKDGYPVNYLPIETLGLSSINELEFQEFLLPVVPSWEATLGPRGGLNLQPINVSYDISHSEPGQPNAAKPPATPGYSRGRRNRPRIGQGPREKVFGVSHLSAEVQRFYRQHPTVIEYEVGTTTAQRYRGLQRFIEETRQWSLQGLGSNPYRYFLDPISMVPSL